MTTLTPKPPTQPPDPGQGGDSPGPNGWIEFVKWLLGDHRRAAWAFATVVVVLLAAVTTAGLLAPYLGDLGGLVGGGVVVGGLGGGLVAARYRRQGRNSDDE